MKISIVTLLLFCVATSANAEMSFSEYSKLKSNLSRFGEFIGFYEACTARSTFTPDYRSVCKSSCKLPTPDGMQSKVISSLEKLDFDFKDLEKLDDVVRDARIRKKDQVFSTIQNMIGSSYFETCMTIAISVSAIESLEKNLPEDATKRVAAYADLSPLQ